MILSTLVIIYLVFYFIFISTSIFGQKTPINNTGPNGPNIKIRSFALHVLNLSFPTGVPEIQSCDPYLLTGEDGSLRLFF